LRASVLQLARRLRPGLEAEGMGTLKLSVLSRLGRQGPMSPTELARGEGVRLQSLTRLIAELEADGWVHRSADPADGRRALLALTRQGMAGLRAAVEAAEQAMASHLQALPADDLAVLQRACGLLDQLEHSLATTGGFRAQLGG